MTEHFPPIDRNLLIALDKMYPERCPALSTTDREIWAAVGRRQVVRKLWDVYREQQENPLQHVYV